jgi:hypothetical protein
MDEALEGELAKFNLWFMERQQNQGVLEPSPLATFEKGILKAYLLYASTERPEEC